MRRKAPVPFGKGPTEKDPNHGHLAGGLLHSGGDHADKDPLTRAPRRVVDPTCRDVPEFAPLLRGLPVAAPRRRARHPDDRDRAALPKGRRSDGGYFAPTPGGV